MRVKILGSGAATAMPLPFCNCGVCTAARKSGGKDFRKRSAAMVNENMLIDLSPDLGSMAAMYRLDLGRIQYLLQTHSHADHFDAGHFLTRRSSYAAKNLTHMDIICSQGTLQGMNYRIQVDEPDVDLREMRWQKDMRYTLHQVRAGEEIRLGEYVITALDSVHDRPDETLVYLIGCQGKKMLYGTDLAAVIPETWRCMEQHQLDLVFLDQTYGEGYNAGCHLDAGQVAGIVADMKRRGITNERSRVYATHISHEGNALHEEMERLAGTKGYSIAYDGCDIVL